MTTPEPDPTSISVVEDLCEAIAGRLVYLRDHAPLDRQFVRLQEAKLAAAKQALRLIECALLVARPHSQADCNELAQGEPHG